MENGENSLRSLVDPLNRTLCRGCKTRNLSLSGCIRLGEEEVDRSDKADKAKPTPVKVLFRKSRQFDGDVKRRKIINIV